MATDYCDEEYSLGLVVLKVCNYCSIDYFEWQLDLNFERVANSSIVTDCWEKGTYVFKNLILSMIDCFNLINVCMIEDRHFKGL